MNTNYLMIPIQVDALRVDSEKIVVEQAADFANLPYFNGRCDKNGDNANISEAIASVAFNNQTLRLGPGIHLHWALPDSLTQGVSTENGVAFPEIPNRWLIRRCRKEAGGRWQTEKQWVVESDYLFPEGMNKEGICVSYPYQLDEEGNHQTFRFAGRKMPLSVWNPDYQHSATSTYLSTLTAVGYGNFYFASFYPNCYSMLGFNDTNPGAIDDTLRYEVIGWYGSADRDDLKKFVDGLDIQSGYDVAINERYQWQADRDQKPDGLVCYARLGFNPTSDNQNSERLAETTITVGNSVSEALAARLAKTLDEGNKELLEKQLMAIQYMDELERLDTDYVAQFRQWAHEREFSNTGNGTLWTLANTSDGNIAPEDKKVENDDLPGQVADLLDKINSLQAAYNQQQDQIAALRKTLFADWYKYMMCQYPSDRRREDYPDIDCVRHFIAEKAMRPLAEKLNLTGTLLVSKDAQTGDIVAASARNPQGETLEFDARYPVLAARLAYYLNQLIAAVNTINQQQSVTSVYRVLQIAEPRFWQPNDPVVLITGDAVKPTPRHGQDGTLNAHLFTTPYSLQDNAAYDVAVFSELSDKLNSLADDDKGLQTWTRQPWNAFLLEWEVNLYPISNKSNLFSRSGRYESGFISDNYEAGMDSPDLTLKANLGKIITNVATTYGSRTVLSGDSGETLKARLATYIDSKVLAAYQADSGAGVDDLDESIDDIKSWYETTYGNDSTNPIYTALCAYRELTHLNCLSQALGGFNQALLMRREVMELPLADPVGFGEYQAFSREVAQLMGGQTATAPTPLTDFNPIRTGCLAINQLRLIDSFGQHRDLDVSRVATTEKMTTPASSSLISLPPRLAQPARVHFRWLAAGQNQREMNAHTDTGPICGWVVPNYFDRTLVIYATDGEPMGAINQRGEWDQVAGFPLTAPDALENPHLRKMVTHLLNTSQKDERFIGKFLAVLESALDNIEPDSYAQNQTTAVLMGRPIALVRAFIDLELQGLPAVNQNWSVLLRDLNAQKKDITQRESDNFPNIKFPVRLGHYRQFNDGLVGYWIETAESDSGYEKDTFFSPQANEPDSDYIDAFGIDGNPINFYQSVNDPPFNFSMLMDVQGVIHATTGILPAKALSIPPEQYTEALQRIAVTFLVAPFISEAGKVKLSLPVLRDYDWSWIHQENRTDWSPPLTIAPAIDRSVFTAQVASSEADALWDYLIDEARWLTTRESERGRAYIAPVGDRTLATLGLSHDNRDFSAQAPAVEAVFAAYGEQIVANSSRAVFGKPEAREGWLKLTRMR